VSQEPCTKYSLLRPGDLNFYRKSSRQDSTTLPVDTASDAESAQNKSRGLLLSPIQEYIQHIGHRESVTSSGPVAIFKDVKVFGGDTKLIYQESVLNLLLFPLRLLLALFSQRKSAKKLILNGVDGVIKEGEMLLVLGKPGSGCTTLLKTLAGSAGGFRGWSGDITYYGVPIDEIRKKFRRDLVYNAEGRFFNHQSKLYI
jgi:ABC-type glutathione transport system ATPase component